MNQYLRRETLEHLISKIYGITTVNINHDSYERGKYGEVIRNKSGLFDKNSYKLTPKNNFDALFDITFNVPECDFTDQFKKEHTEFNRDIAIQNVTEYLKEFGIQVPNFIENEKEKILFSKLIYKLISKELLPVIFNTDDNREKRKYTDLDFDDITPDFTIAINNVKAVLESKDIVQDIYRNAKMSDIEMIYDSDIKDLKIECMLVTCICTNKIALSLVDWGFEPSIDLYIEPKSYNVNSSNYAYYNSPIEQLKKDSFLFNYDGNTAFNFPEDVYISQKAIEVITVSFLENTATTYFLPRYFYYAPNLQPNSSELYNENSFLISETSACVRIKRKASIALSEKYRPHFKKYYENVLDSIIKNIDLITTVDYKIFLDSIRCEKTELEKALGNMALNVEKLYDILSNRYYDETDIKNLIIWLISYSVSMLNNAIKTIISVPNWHGPNKSSNKNISSFIEQLNDYVSRYDIFEFVNKIESYLGKLQQIQEISEIIYSETYRNIKKFGTDISIDIDSKYTKTKKKLSELYLDKSVLKDLYQNLITFTSILKDNKAPA